MILFLLIAAAVTNPSQISFSQDSSQAARRSLANKFTDTVSVKDAPWLAVGDGSANDANAFSLALGVHKGKISAPASTYYLGTTGITITTSDRWIDGEGYGSPGAGPTSFVYTGSGCAITVESAQRVHLSNIDIQVNSASSTAACLCFRSTTLNPEFPIVENVSCTNTGTQRLAGQVGLWLDDTGAGIYWGVFKGMHFKGWDTSILLQGSASQGVNDNDFADLMSYGHNIAWRAIGAGSGLGNVSDNTVKGLKCSRSDGAFVGTSTCMLWGDDGSVAFGNENKVVDNDSGSPSVCGSFGVNTGANSFEGSCESGGGFADNQGATTTPTNIANFPNDVKNRLGLGSTTNLLKIGNLITTRGAQIIGTTFFGRTGGATGSGTGDTVQIGGGATGGSGLAGGDLQLLGGSGLGQTNGSGGNILVFPGTRNGTGNGGAVIVGPAPGLTISSGFKVRSARVTKFNKPFPPIDCTTTTSPTVSQVEEGSRFTCATAQTLTLPTAQGSSGLVQAMTASSGSPVAVPVTVGDIFEFSMKSTAAANFTLAVGTGITILGNAVVNNTKYIWECEVTDVTPNSEKLRCY